MTRWGSAIKCGRAGFFCFSTVPELPEVETTRRGCAPVVEQRVITRLTVREPRLRWLVPPEAPAAVAGQRVVALRRRGKYLIFDLERGALLLHLGMSGSLRVVSHDAPPAQHDHVDVVLDSGLCLRFNDPRRFGCLVWTPADPLLHPLLRDLGPEPLSPEFDGAYLTQALRKRRVAIKLALMDGRLVVGVGNIYASEALFRARVRPRRAAGRVTRSECAALADAVKRVLTDAIRAGGTTLRDYLNADGAPGYFRQKLYVYERKDEPCRICKTPVRHLVQAQRSTYFCPTCQK